MLARNARTAVIVGGLVAYPTGVEFEVRVLTARNEWLDPSLSGVLLRPGGPREGDAAPTSKPPVALGGSPPRPERATIARRQNLER